MQSQRDDTIAIGNLIPKLFILVFKWTKIEFETTFNRVEPTWKKPIKIAEIDRIQGQLQIFFADCRLPFLMRRQPIISKVNAQFD